MDGCLARWPGNVVVTALERSVRSGGDEPDPDHAEPCSVSCVSPPVGGAVYIAVFSLATSCNSKPREITVTIPPDKFFKNR